MSRRAAALLAGGLAVAAVVFLAARDPAGTRAPLRPGEAQGGGGDDVPPPASATPDAPPVAITGFVVRAADGAPLPGAELRLFRMERIPRPPVMVPGSRPPDYMFTEPLAEPLRVLAADAQGAFAFPAPCPCFAVEARAPGLLSAHLYVDARNPPDALTLELEAGTRETLRVVDRQGAPVATATVRVYDAGILLPPREVLRADAAGLVTAQLVDGDQWVVEAPGFLSRRVRDPRALRANGIVLDPGYALTGDVVDGQGTPLPGVHVVAAQDLEGVDGGQWDPVPLRVVVTDERGAFRFDGIGHRARGVGLHEEEYVAEPATAQPGGQPVRLVALRPGRVAGRAVLAGGAPAAQAVVWISTCPSAHADADGRFAFARVLPGTHVLTACGLEDVRGQLTVTWSAAPQFVELAEGGRLDGVTFVLEPQPVSIARVVLLDGEGRPVRRVDLHGSATAEDGSATVVVEQPAGFDLALSVGQSAPRYLRSTFHVTTAPLDGPDPPVQVLRLPRTREAVFHLRDETGGPLPGALTVDLEVSEGWDTHTGRDWRPNARKDRRFTLPAEGRVTWCARADGFLPADGELGAEDVVEVRLGRGARVTGRVVDASGAPFPGAFLVGENAGRHVATVTDEAGRFTLGGLAAGRVRLRAGDRDHPSAFVEVDVEEGGGADVGTLMVARPRTVRGVVRDEAGRPVAAARVACVSSLFPAWNMEHDEVVAGPDGRFTLEAVVGTGNSWLVASADGLGARLVPVDADDLVITLPAEARLALCIEPHGHSGVYVLAGPPGVPVFWKPPDATWDGTTLVRRLPPGRLRIRVVNPQTREQAEDEVELTAGETATLVLQLPAED